MLKVKSMNSREMCKNDGDNAYRMLQSLPYIRAPQIQLSNIAPSTRVEGVSD